MKPLRELLADLELRDVRIALEGERLRVDAPKDAITPELRATLAARKAELVEHFRNVKAPAALPRPGALLRVPPDEPARVSPGQRRILSLAKLRPDSAVYNIPTAFRLEGPLDVHALEASLGDLERRHESLRTAFVEIKGKSYQRVLAPGDASLPVVDLAPALAALAEDGRERAIVERVQQEVRRPFDLEQGRLWRALLLKTGHDEHVLVLTMHHIVFDGRSKPIYLEEAGEAYRARIEGRAPAFPELPIRYADFAHWQREAANDPHQQRRLAYWKRQLGGTPAELELPADRPRPAAGERGARSAAFALGGRTASALKALSRQEQSSLYITLLAAFCALLHVRTGQDDMLVCSPFASRDRAEFEGLIGYLNTIVVMRVDLAGDPGFRELVARVRRVAFEAFENQQVPLQRLAELPELARVPLTRAMFSYQDTSSRTLDLPGIVATPVHVRKESSDFDLAFYAEGARDGGLGGVLEYNADLFDDATIARLLADYTRLLEAVAADPHREIGRLPRSGPDRHEVEARLGAHPQIDRAVVVRRPGHAGLVAYLVLNEDDVPRLDDIRAFLRGAFPHYLVPASLVTIDRFPLLADGSVDVAALPPPPASRSRLGRPCVAPRTPLERRLAQVWKRVLWLDVDVGVDDGFVELGGHSLLSAQLVVEVEAELGRELPSRALTQLGTVADMARILEEEAPAQAATVAPRPQSSRASPSGLPDDILRGLRTFTAAWTGERATPESLVVGLNASGAKLPLFWCLQRYQELSQLARYLGPDQPVWGMRNGHKVMERDEPGIAMLARHYVGEILAVRPAGPFIVGGNCGASRVGFQVARQLSGLGHEVALLFMHEKFVPQPYEGRVALMFGRESDRNPYLHFAKPEQGWRKYYTGPLTFDYVRGAHAEFFVEPNVQVLTDTIRRRMAEVHDGVPPAELLPVADAPMQRLPDEAYRARLVPGEARTAHPGATTRVEVAITNASAVTWERYDRSGIALVDRWLAPDGRAIAAFDGWSPLPAELAPGATVVLGIDATAPRSTGRWTLAFDLVDEGVTTFAARGSTAASLDVVVAGTPNSVATDYNSAPLPGTPGG